MFLIEAAQFTKSASDGLRIDSEARKECEGIMSQIYGESPSSWPYGLDMGGHDGGVWLVRDPGTLKAAGFVGWQERKEKAGLASGRLLKVGYYSIGILPEYRGNGYAKDAVAQVIREKSASVDVVRAFIVPGNNSSMALAKSLGIPIVHTT